jgi:hypothetical protein
MRVLHHGSCTRTMHLVCSASHLGYMYDWWWRPRPIGDRHHGPGGPHVECEVRLALQPLVIGIVTAEPSTFDRLLQPPDGVVGGAQCGGDAIFLYAGQWV